MSQIILTLPELQVATAKPDSGPVLELYAGRVDRPSTLTVSEAQSLFGAIGAWLYQVRHGLTNGRLSDSGRSDVENALQLLDALEAGHISGAELSAIKARLHRALGER